MTLMLGYDGTPGARAALAEAPRTGSRRTLSAVGVP